MINDNALATDGVLTRISWGAVFAGAFVALVALSVLSLFGAAVGISITKGQAPSGVPSLIWGVFVAIVALYFGGWTTSQCVVHENRREAVLYGLVLWGVIYLGAIGLTYFDVYPNFSLVTGMAGPGSRMQLSPLQIIEIARALNLSPNEVNQLMEAVRGLMRNASLVASTWWMLAGVVASLIASVFGTIAGSDLGFSRRRPRVVPREVALNP